MSFAFMPVYTGDYLRDTQHLSCSEHGIYFKLLMHCWDQRGPAPWDERKLAGIVNARSADEVEALRRVLTEFFVRMDDGWYNRRMMREVERAAALSEKKSTAGKLGAAVTNSRKRKEIPAPARHVLGSSSADARHEPLPLPPHSPPQPPLKTPAALPRGFAAFWSAYPHFPQRSSRSESLKRWHALKLEPVSDDVMRSLQACLAVPAWTKDGHSFVSAAEVWLRKKLWEQEPQTMNDGLLESILSDPRCK